MEDLITRTGGESETRAGKLIPSFVIDTAGAPASAPVPGDKAAAAPEWIELLPAGVFYGRDGRGPFWLDDPQAVIESTTAMQMNAGLPIVATSTSSCRSTTRGARSGSGESNTIASDRTRAWAT